MKYLILAVALTASQANAGFAIPTSQIGSISVGTQNMIVESRDRIDQTKWDVGLNCKLPVENQSLVSVAPANTVAAAAVLRNNALRENQLLIVSVDGVEYPCSITNIDKS